MSLNLNELIERLWLIEFVSINLAALLQGIRLVVDAQIINF